MVLVRTEKEFKRWKDLMEKEDKRYEKVQRAIEKKDKKTLDNFFDFFLGRSSKKERENWL